MARTEKNFNVVLDTNFVVDLFRFKLGFDDVEDALGGNCGFFMVEQSVAELRRLKNVNAKVGAGFVDSGKIGVVDAGRPAEKSADEAIVELAERRRPGVVVATNDKKLRKRIKASGVRTIYLRARKRLEVS